MLEQTVTVGLKNGLDARAIASLVQSACRYDCNIYLQTGEKKVNAKSIMGMMNVGVQSGKEVVVIADGGDESYAADAMVEYIRG